MLIQNLYDLNIFVDELNIFEAPGVVFVKGDIYEAIMNPIPICELELVVPTGWIDDRSLVDGTLIRFQIRSDEFNIENRYDFRLFNIKELNAEQRYMHITLEGVIDFYDGYSHANEHNMYGSTSSVFKSVATKYGLRNEIDNTNDAQLWVAGENNLYQFLNKICKYGYVDETSAMFWCLDRHKCLLYKNLTTLFRNRQEKVWTFVQTPTPNLKDKQYGYTSASASIQAGLNNLQNGGYGGSDIYFDFPSYSWKEVASRKVVAESKLINISKDLSKGLAQDWYAFNIGNFHPHYVLANKQNKRILSTYSSYVTLTSQFFQPCRIGQIVNYEYLDAQDQDNKIFALSGTFMISAIHIEFALSAISSIYELVMQGLNGTALTRETY